MDVDQGQVQRALQFELPSHQADRLLAVTGQDDLDARTAQKLGGSLAHVGVVVSNEDAMFHGWGARRWASVGPRSKLRAELGVGRSNKAH